MILSEFQKKNTDEQESDSYANYLLCLSLDIGEELLKSGAEVHRVENTIERICMAYGAAHVEVFAITSLIIASVRMSDNSYSNQVRHVYNSSFHLSNLEEFNAVSRTICRDTPALEEADRMIREAKTRRNYPVLLLFLGSLLTSGSFTLFFGGGIRDAVVALFIGIVVAAIDRIRSSYINQLAKLVITSFVAGSLAYLSVMLGLGVNLDAILIGTIMLLIPGLAFGNAVRDLLCGDILAGILRTVQSCLSAVLIAFGFMMAALLLESFGFVRAEITGGQPLWVELVSATIGTASFSLMFRSKVKYLPVVSVCGFFTISIYLFAASRGLSQFLCAFLAASFTMAFSEACARILHAPTIAFSAPGAISIVPGSALYYTMDALLFGESGRVSTYFTQTLLISAGIALGMVLVSIITNSIVHLAQNRRKKTE